MEVLKFIPGEFIKFFMVFVFSLLIGLEQRRHHINEEEEKLFGTDRTFTFIGLFAYVLFIADPQTYIPFLTGLVVLAALLGVQYFLRIRLTKRFGLTSTILALLTYCLPILVFNEPVWLALSFFVVLLTVTELKELFINLSKKASEVEFITLAKFIIFAGIILPLLPDAQISDKLPISPYHLWLAIVVVSGISYASYLLKKFVFPDSGIFLTGILGGIYSSTAATVILARSESKIPAGAQTISAIMIANGMMYLRILFLAFLFNHSVAEALAIPFSLMFVVTFILSRLAAKKTKEAPTASGADGNIYSTKNPLEFKTAAIFGILFVVFALITDFVKKEYGGAGVTSLAYVVGVTDIDPFLLNLLQQNVGISLTTAVLAIINATNSNNVLKMIYALSLSGRGIRKSLIINFSILVLSGVSMAIAFYLIQPA
jgi:uncharacterized membrane protein (DUF4010 family)